MDTVIELTKIEALDMAIDALIESAEKYHFDARVIDTLGRNAPRDVQKRAAKRKKILTAIGELKAIKYNIELCP